MSVEFDEQSQPQSINISTSNPINGLTGFLLQRHIVKSVRQANIIFITVALVFSLVAISIMIFTHNKYNPPIQKISDPTANLEIVPPPATLP